ncbi:Fe-S cluster assembly protein SufD [Leptolyngbya sp. CCY15150]|uniref:Fe-S cluster assembly protein SufD n=1 Tax=Leptolyngbya sp. CCY15150 TaxID=2767772 RepID=UPI0019513986|nr:Fe-S cluster assembly protein SufD [Leptolyngbya sp. CCY15150]
MQTSTLTPPRVDRHAYLVQLLSQRLDVDETRLDGATLAWLKELRHQAVAQLQTATLPTQRDEDWRFTDLSSLLAVDFEAAQPNLEAIAPEALTQYDVPEAIAQLVFVDGIYAPTLSTLGELPAAVTVGSLLEVAPRLGDRLPTYLAQQTVGQDVFATLNTAGLQDAAIIWAGKNQAIAQPIHVLYLSRGDRPSFSQPRCLVVAEPNSALTLVETFACLDAGTYLSNSVTEIWVEENAGVNHVRLQQDSETAFHLSRTVVNQARSARYRVHDISLGAALSRRNLDVFHSGEQVETLMNGLTMIQGKQVADTHSLINYAKPYGSSRQLHKCIVDDKAHTIFNGRVNVPQAAQLTDAAQLNRCLLLSPKARVDTKPQLEIVADNVKCTHGATVSQLEADEVFYLQSRGIDAESAQSLLIYAFAFEILGKIPVESVQKRLSQFVSAHAR